MNIKEKGYWKPLQFSYQEQTNQLVYLKYYYLKGLAFLDNPCLSLRFFIKPILPLQALTTHVPITTPDLLLPIRGPVIILVTTAE